MDPNACWLRMLNAIKDEDYQEAQFASQDLLDWLDRGGFPPEISGNRSFDRQMAITTCELARIHACENAL